jgi:hypothetical protein
MPTKTFFSDVGVKEAETAGEAIKAGGYQVNPNTEKTRMALT